MKKRKITVFIVFFCIVVCLGCGKKEAATGEEEAAETEGMAEVDGPVYNDDGTMTIPEGGSAYGFYDLETNKIIDSGTTIEITDDKLEGSIHFHQNFSIRRSYILIILIDYIQHEFYVGGQCFRSYPFQLEGDIEVYVNISVPISESEGHEFAYIIVPNPEIKSYLSNGEYDWDVMFSDRRLKIGRFNLSKKFQEKEEQEFPANYEIFQAEVNTTGFELVKSREEPAVCVEGRGGERLELEVLNQAEEAEEITYVVMGFADWEQVPVDGEHLKYYATVQPGTSVYIPVVLPKVTEPTVFQIIAFSEPDTMLNKYNWDNPTTFRVLVRP